MQPPNSGTGHQTEGDNEDPNHPSRGPAGSSGDHEQPLSIDRMFLLALVVGVFGGLGAIVFRSIIALFQNIFFYGNFALSYDPDAHIEPSPFGAFIILVPVVGAILVTWITRTLAPEARGHGVPEVLGAIYHRRGHISPVVVLAKSLASAISVGTGGSVGREGPIIQIGSAFGSTLGQLTRIPTRQRITLIGAGAAAGIAATFNAPIGGLAFAIELLLVSISVYTVALVAAATVTATYIGRLYSGLEPSFDVPSIAHFADHLVNLYTLLLCLPFGLLVGGASALFIRTLYWMEDGFHHVFRNEYLRHICGMLAVGLLMYAMLRLAGHYYVAGVGYATIMDVLRGVLEDPMLLAALFAAKLLATTLTLGSGASGGVFSPSLFLGATLGGAFGGFFAWILPGVGIEPVVFAVAGMAGMVSGTTGAVLTAITMLVEQTRDYNAILPIITTVGLASVVRVWLTPESIYTLKLARRGTAVPQGLESPVSSGKTVQEMMSTDFEVVDVSEIRDWQLRYRPGEGPRYTVVAENGRIRGVARPELVYLLRDIEPDAVIDSNVFFATGETRWSVVMRGLRIKETDVALVTTERHSYRLDDLRGVLTWREVAQAAGESAELLE